MDRGVPTERDHRTKRTSPVARDGLLFKWISHSHRQAFISSIEANFQIVVIFMNSPSRPSPQVRSTLPCFLLPQSVACDGVVPTIATPSFSAAWVNFFERSGAPASA